MKLRSYLDRLLDRYPDAHVVENQAAVTILQSYGYGTALDHFLNHVSGFEEAILTAIAAARKAKAAGQRVLLA